MGATGDYYNKPWDAFDPDELHMPLTRAHAAALAAKASIASASPAETALITALQARYPQATPASMDDISTWNDDYANAMGAVGSGQRG